MSDIRQIPRPENDSAVELLNSVMERSADIEGVIVLIQWKDGTAGCEMSSMLDSKKCWLGKYLDIRLTEQLRS